MITSILTHGTAAFGQDEGTLWIEPGSEALPLGELQKTTKHWQKAFKRRLRKRPLVWFVDDESANRSWFVKNHRLHYALLTFSSRKFVTAALQAGTLCDAVVTDVFFPSNPPADDAEADQLLEIYDAIDKSPVSDLPSVWAIQRKKWSLDGFEIARDVAEYAARRKELIPVLLFSRKATLLLGSGDWLVDPSSAVENTHWMLEKLNPSETGEGARRAASIQRDRINAVLRYRKESIKWWWKLLRGFNVGWGPVSYSLGTLKPKD